MVEFADYQYYMEKFHGSAIPETAFPNVSLKASIYVKYITFGRVTDSFGIDYPQYADDIKTAVCAVAEVMYKDQLSRDETGREKRSEDNDGYSVSFVTSADSKEESLEKKQYKAVYPYLIHTGLMYRGVRE